MGCSFLVDRLLGLTNWFVPWTQVETYWLSWSLLFSFHFVWSVSFCAFFTVLSVFHLGITWAK